MRQVLADTAALQTDGPLQRWWYSRAHGSRAASSVQPLLLLAGCRYHSGSNGALSTENVAPEQSPPTTDPGLGSRPHPQLPGAAWLKRSPPSSSHHGLILFLTILKESRTFFVQPYDDVVVRDCMQLGDAEQLGTTATHGTIGSSEPSVQRCPGPRTVHRPGPRSVLGVL